MSKKTDLAYQIWYFETALASIKAGPNTKKEKHDSMVKKAKWHFHYHSVNKGLSFESALKESLMIACRGDQKRYESAINHVDSVVLAKPIRPQSVISRISAIGGIFLKRN